MPDYFDLKNLRTERFPRQEPRFTQEGTEWRRLIFVNLQWAEAVVEKGIAKPEADNERLGFSVLFVERLRAALLPKEYPREDLHEDIFGTWEGDF